MKKISIAVIILVASLSAMAQDNKPTAGCFGIGYAVGFFPVQQNVGFSYLVADNLEIGGSLGFQFNHSRNSTYDSIFVTGTNFTNLPARRENENWSQVLGQSFGNQSRPITTDLVGHMKIQIVGMNLFERHRPMIIPD